MTTNTDFSNNLYGWERLDFSLLFLHLSSVNLAVLHILCMTTYLVYFNLHFVNQQKLETQTVTQLLLKQ